MNTGVEHDHQRSSIYMCFKNLLQHGCCTCMWTLVVLQCYFKIKSLNQCSLVGRILGCNQKIKGSNPGSAPQTLLGPSAGPVTLTSSRGQITVSWPTLRSDSQLAYKMEYLKKEFRCTVHVYMCNINTFTGIHSFIHSCVFFCIYLFDCSCKHW